jgi:hypothetical protein
MDALVHFVRARLAEGLMQAQEHATLLTRNADRLGVDPVKASAFAQEAVTAAQARVRLFDETIFPYLWVDGRAGRLAALQARLLAFQYTAHPDYLPGWTPDQA